MGPDRPRWRCCRCRRTRSGLTSRFSNSGVGCQYSARLSVDPRPAGASSSRQVSSSSSASLRRVQVNAARTRTEVGGLLVISGAWLFRSPHADDVLRRVDATRVSNLDRKKTVPTSSSTGVQVSTRRQLITAPAGQSSPAGRHRPRRRWPGTCTFAHNHHPEALR